MVESAEDKYDIPYTYRKHFSPESCTELIKTFKNYDKNGDAKMDKNEFKAALKDMGHDEVSDEQAGALLARFDKDNSGFIEWVEYLDLMQTIKVRGKKSGLDNIVKEIKGVGGAHQQTSTSGAVSTYLDEEVSTFSRSINNELKDDALVKERLPIDPDSADLFDSCSDGIIGLHLLHKLDPDRIDMRTINRGSNLNIYKVRENLDQFFAACQGLIRIIGIDAQSFLDKTPNLMLAVIWQIVRLLATQAINLKDCNEIFRLLKDGEELADLMKLPPEEILKRWVNYHLAKAGEAPVGNLGKDLADSTKLMIVLNQLDPANCSKDGIDEADLVKRAGIMIDNSKKMGCDDVVGPKDVVKGNPKVNILLVAEMFNTKHGLDELEEKLDLAGIIDDDIEGSKEERAFRMWINSLGIEGVFIDSLFHDLQDGLVLLKVIHRINDKVVEWDRVQKEPNNIFKKGINC